MSEAVPELVERTEMTRRLNAALSFDARTTAVITVDCHRGHLDPEIATMPVAPEAAASVVGNTARLLDAARAAGMSVIHVILVNRLVDGECEAMQNPFWRSVEEAREMLTPDRPSTISGHNLEGSPQTELMPQLGPAPGDVVLRTKRRLSIYRETELDRVLAERAIETVVLVGINTNTCVLCAAFESLNRDLQTIVVRDCVHSMYGDDLHFFGLQNVARCLGWVLTADEVVEKSSVRR